MLEMAEGRVGQVEVWGEKAEDDITMLPKEWEARVADDNRVFFLNHEKKSTQWEHPLTRQRYRVDRSLPYGWQRYKDSEDSVYFVDHINQYSSGIDPRLLSEAVFDLPVTYHIKRTNTLKEKFRPLARAAEVMKKVDLSQKVAIVTGGNSGLGFRTAFHLADRGAHVILACRHMIRANNAVSQIQKLVPDAKIEAMECDLASLHSVKTFAESFKSLHLPLHILVLNAAVFGGPLSFTVDGIERHFAVNHLGHFYLANQLVSVMKDSSPSRVVVVSSESHWYTNPKPTSALHLSSIPHPPKHLYTPITAYGVSKLCNLLFAQEFHRKHSLSGVSCNSVHPGNLLPTNLMRDAGMLYRLSTALARPFTKSVEQAVSTILYCAAHPAMANVSGLYMYECWPVEPSDEAQDLDVAAALWRLSEQLVAERTSPPPSNSET